MQPTNTKVLTTFKVTIGLFFALAPLVVMAVEPDLNSKFFDAAKRGDLAQVRSVLSKGAKVNAKDGKGRTALMFAAGNGNIELVNLLVKEGAEVDAKANTGTTVLMAAVYPYVVEKRNPKVFPHPVSDNNLEVVTKLLENSGVNVNAKTKYGMTVLMFAVMGGNSKIVKLLLEKGADVKAKDKWGSTALKIATAYEKSYSYKGIVEPLKAHGAKE